MQPLWDMAVFREPFILDLLDRNPEMSSKTIPFSLVHFESIESTHRWVLSNLPLLVSKHGLSPSRPVRVSADRQTAGVGQTARGSNGEHSTKTWVGSTGNIFVTYVFPWPEKKIASVFHTPLVALAAVVATLRHYGLEPSVKWVNDVIVDGGKISGILCAATEFSLPDPEYSAILVSIGLNVMSTPSLAHLNKDEKQSVTCMATELAKCGRSETSSPTDPLSTSSVLDVLSIELFKTMGLYEERGFPSFRSILAPILVGKGQKVGVRAACIAPSDHTAHPVDVGEILEGELLGLSPITGYLQLKLGNGEMKELLSGHVI